MAAEIIEYSIKFEDGELSPVARQEQSRGKVEPVKKGPWLIWTADADGKELNRPVEGRWVKQDPGDRQARHIASSPNGDPGNESISEGLEVLDQCDRITHALNELYSPDSASAEERFRIFYRRVFGVAVLAAQELQLQPVVAKAQLDRIERDIIDDEGVRVKSKEIKNLAERALRLGVPLALAYIVLMFSTGARLETWLGQIGINRVMFANFLVLWMGTFLGVCLSYALSHPGFRSVDELVVPQNDYLSPVVRLVFTGIMAMILAMFGALGWVDLTVGGTKVFASVKSPDQQMLVLVVGMVCGIGEKLLPAKVLAKTGDVIGKLK